MATTALAVPVLASGDEPTPAVAQPAPSVDASLVAFTATTAAPPTTAAPTKDELFAAQWNSWTPTQQFNFRFMIAPPEEQAQILRYLFPPPPPPPPPPAPKPAPAPKAAPAPRPAPSQAGHAGPGGYLACVRQHESGGRYNINTGNGYYGAYQFLPSTWNATAKRAGRPDLVGVLPSNASPADQDAMALALYQTNGRQPWAGDGC